MRPSLSSIVLGCLASCWAVGLTPSAPASSPKSTAPPAAASAADNDDAAKHAKRTRCLQQAKKKRLIGAQKADYIKTCTTGP